MKLYSVKKWDDSQLTVKEDWTNDVDLNPVEVCTEGFVPLEVQIQKFEQSGVRARFRSEMFDSNDMRDMYLGPNTRIFADDDLETINEKLALQNQIKQEIMLRYYKQQQQEREDTGRYNDAIKQNFGVSKPKAGSDADSEGAETAK